MLKFLTEKECRSLGINPGNRVQVELTIKFMVVGGQIAVMWASPAISCDLLTKRLAVAMPKYSYAAAPEQQTFIYRLGTTWSVTDLEGAPVVWQRNFHDHARKALSRFVIELDRQLQRINMSEEGFADDFYTFADTIARMGLRQPAFDRLQSQVIVLCGCDMCSKPEHPSVETCCQIGYVPVYISIPSLTHQHMHFVFVQKVMEACATAMLTRELARQKAQLAREVQMRLVVRGPSIEA
ncbi:hypothetical protein KBC55_02105 [Patescibacteria group bacterium]|nr:hypothetical protein [Patescibacteria group bacterium]